MAAFVLRVALLLLGIAAVGCDSSGDRLFAEAQRAMEDDNVESAARLYQEVTIQAPESPLAAEAYYELARIYYLRLKNVQAARDSLTTVLQDYPDSTVGQPARSLLARLYDEVFKEPDKALMHYRALLAEDLDDDVRRDTLLAIGRCYYQLNALDAAKDAYRRVLAPSYHPDTDGAYLRLANLEWLSGGTDESLRLLRELQTKTEDPERHREAMLSEFEILMSLGRFPDAHARLREAENTFPRWSELQELATRLQATETLLAPLDGVGEEALLQEQQKKIRWGAGRRQGKSAPREP
ncbi:MAG: tetratricopeptide repeat protein [Acidobacteria bacterium]|nr:MAG: tetratricopeptide repeat protein [Acidobacteriota bacterium]